MSVARRNVSYAETLYTRPTKDNVRDDGTGLVGALCMTCGRAVDSEEIVEGGVPGRHTFVRVLYKHHGAEELVTHEFDSTEWDDHELKRAASRVRLFDPTKVLERASFGGGPRK